MVVVKIYRILLDTLDSRTSITLYVISLSIESSNPQIDHWQYLKAHYPHPQLPDLLALAQLPHPVMG